MSQGPGWWIASDGKWYPPESAPTAVAPPPGWWQASDGRWYPPDTHPDYPYVAKHDDEPPRHDPERSSGSDEAVQSDPVPAEGPPAGWYADPAGMGRRFWDGVAWTEHVLGPTPDHHWKRNSGSTRSDASVRGTHQPRE